MEQALILLRWAVDAAWRVSIVLAVFGALVIAAHKAEWPEPNVLAPWIGLATVAFLLGIALAVMSACAWIALKISVMPQKIMWKIRRRSYLRASVQSLDREEFVILRELLASGQRQVQTHTKSRAYSLVQKGVLDIVSATPSQFICEVPRPLFKDRKRLIQAIDGRLARQDTAPPSV